ncbi:hypothetical protein BLNAU_22499 [Blattamonas nauphoetae]|uniref:Uncharacterized protein n=1 Tax=Blattamonas nauphoetae TaxID=2049346 RepID=A0ABQ9WV33_9EUKA|nr:hypothetical protein BLNAU_22499 [Blattamonas nauphoetae]
MENILDQSDKGHTQMISSEDPEYSPFLKWNPTDPITVDSAGRVFISLGSMVRDGFQFDEKLLQKASTFLSSSTWNLYPRSADDLLKAIGQDSPDPVAVIFDRSTFHQPTLDFVCSSRIPMAFQSLLSKVEDEGVNQFVIWLQFDNISIWKEDGTDTVSRWMLLLQTLEQEGDGNTLDDELVSKASMILSSLKRTFNYWRNIDAFLKSVGQGSPNHAAFGMLSASQVVVSLPVPIQPSEI